MYYLCKYDEVTVGQLKVCSDYLHYLWTLPRAWEYELFGPQVRLTMMTTLYGVDKRKEPLGLQISAAEAKICGAHTVKYLLHSQGCG